jgi:hypothetical protein
MPRGARETRRQWHPGRAVRHGPLPSRTALGAIASGAWSDPDPLRSARLLGTGGGGATESQAPANQERWLGSRPRVLLRLSGVEVDVVWNLPFVGELRNAKNGERLRRHDARHL